MNNVDGTSALNINHTLDYEIKCSSVIISLKEAEEKLKNYSDISKFDDEIWVINKINKDKNIDKNCKSIYFNKIKSKKCQNEIKIWAIMLLIQKKSIITVNGKIKHISYLYNYLTDSSLGFEQLTNICILNFYNYLFEKKCSSKTKLDTWFSIKSFLKDMHFDNAYNIMNKFVIEEKQTTVKIDDKYIPDEVCIKLDLRMKKNDIHQSFKAIYWLLRLIPNRITEVVSMTNKCLKQIDKDTYILSIPTFKQTGSYNEGGVKLIEIKYKGIGILLIDLIKKQIEYIKSLELENPHNFIFYCPSYNFIQDENGNYNGNYNFKLRNKKPIIITRRRVATFLKSLCNRENFLDDNGNKINVTSHKFRHNAITDRLTSGIFRNIDITGLTAHHNTRMIDDSYSHFKTKDLRVEEVPIVFRGRIINTDNELKMNKLLERPYSNRIYKLGICSDIRSCNKDKSKCLRCEYMIPDFDDLDYYRMELQEWVKKKNIADKIDNVPFSELCSYWIESYKILIKKILLAISNDDIDINNLEGGKNDE